MAIVSVDFFSQSLTRMTKFQAILPNDHIHYLGGPEENRKPLKTLVLLHGMTGNCRDWLDQSTVAMAVRGLPVCVLIPSGENSFYSDSVITGNRFGEYIGKELISFARSMLPLSREREDTWIAGLSMGDFGAVTNGLRNPETFGYIGMFSAALIKKLILGAKEEPGMDYFIRRQYEAMFGLNRIADFEGCDADYEALARHVAASGSTKPRFYIDCGTEDPWLYRENQAFVKLLRSLDYDVIWNSRPGTHSWDFWETSIRKALDWFPVSPMEAGENNPYVKAQQVMNEGMAAIFMEAENR